MPEPTTFKSYTPLPGGGYRFTRADGTPFVAGGPDADELVKTLPQELPAWEQPGAGFQWAPADLSATIPRVPNEELPGKFQTHEAPQVRPGRTFARSFAESALDAAALPVKAASRAADYFTGNHSTFSDISGKDAAESLEYLYDRTDPAQVRREERFAAGEIPQAQAAGRLAGEFAGGAPLAALTGRVPAFSPILRLGKPKAKSPLDELDDLSAPATRLSDGTTVPKPREYTPSPRAQEQYNQAKSFIRAHPNNKALRDYMTSGYSDINTALRPGGEKKMTVRDVDTIQKLDKLLDDARSSGLVHEGPTMRGLSLPAGTVERWTAAGAVKNKSYWSTSHDPSVADDFISITPPDGPNEKVLLHLDQKSGVPVGGYEREILMPRNRNWLIKKHELRDDGTNVLHLEEVPELPPGVKPELSYNERELGDAIGRAV